MAASKGSGSEPREPVIENRRARHDYSIEDTLECGIELLGTEVKSIRAGQVSLGEGVRVAEYPPAGAARQHDPDRPRRLLAHRREIRRLAVEVRSRGGSLVPLKMYFLRGKVKLLIGLGFGRRKEDKRQAIAEREAKRDMDRAAARRR